MGSYTITTSADEDNAIVHVSGDPNIDKQVYLEACVHGQLLQPWVRQYWVATSPVPPVDVATGYVTATPEQQQQINDILGLTPTPPDGGGGTPTVATLNYAFYRTAPPAPAGQVRLDTTTDWTTATQLSLAKQTADSQDATATLTLMGAGTTVQLADAAAANTLSASISGAGVDGGTAITFPITLSGTTGSTPTNGTAVTATVTIPVATRTTDRAMTF